MPASYLSVASVIVPLSFYFKQVLLTVLAQAVGELAERRGSGGPCGDGGHGSLPFAAATVAAG